MRLFSCQGCGQILFFENTRCERCRRRLGFWPRTSLIHALEPLQTGFDPPKESAAWSVCGASSYRVRLCANAAHDVCNWLVDADDEDTFCVACRHNRIVPNLGSPGHWLAWRKIEVAKHRLFYTLERLGLLRVIDIHGGIEPLRFDFLADDPLAPPARNVMTGHDNGTITIALGEADDAER